MSSIVSRYLAGSMVSTLGMGAYYKHATSEKHLEESEHCYHGTTEDLGPEEVVRDIDKAVGKTFQTTRGFYFTKEADKHVSIDYAKGLAVSMYRPGDVGEARGRGLLLKFRPVEPKYHKNFLGGACYVPAGRTVVVTGVEVVPPASESSLNMAKEVLHSGNGTPFG